MSTVTERRAAERLLIGGEWVEGGDGGYDIVNPATEEIVGVAPEASVEQARAAARAARDAFPAWSRMKPQQRAERLEAAAVRIREKTDALVPLVIAETGCTATVGRTMQVPVTASRFDRYAAGALEPLVIPLPPQEMPATSLAPGGVMGAIARRAPIGAVACITSYNFPLVNMAGKIGPALAMGNTVVVRPASQDPLAVIELVRILDEVGFPPGVVNVITGSTPATGEVLVDSGDINMISFTGSTAVGLRIAEAGGRTMKRLLLELGGKGACLVFDDANVGAAVGMIGSVWTFHSGQICTAPTRAIVHRSKYDEVVEKLAKMATVLKVGDPLEGDTVVGPLITAAHRDRVEGYIEIGRKEGAEVAAGGGRPAHLERGFYLEPTLLANANNDMRVAREEIFGPVIVAIPFDDDDEGIAIANDTEFGLYDYVFTGDTARGMRVARRLEAGNVGINTIQRNHETPFGGTKLSGIGRDGGSFGLHAYSELQSIVWPS
ncbi:MAG TPA: aldehyde dehydrogenase family protein [Acidimicrobiia bacterium]|nr:aldehyde dehydrogenase family protein [Acidimicrobiia bacterium]